MGVNAYLVIDGRPGPSTSRQDAIDILGFSLDASHSGAGRANVGDVIITKVVDKVSPLLFDDCVTGNYLKTVDILYDKPMGDSQEDYYKVHLEDALITSVHHSGSNENPRELVSFAYSRIKVCYNPEDGGTLKGFIDKGFDVLKLKPW
jgi:type VI secretion system secreted protein Hcp